MWRREDEGEYVKGFDGWLLGEEFAEVLIVGVADADRDRGGVELGLVGTVPSVTSTGLGGGCDAEGGRTGGARTVGVVVLAPKVTVLSLEGIEEETGGRLGEFWTIVDQVEGGGRDGFVGGGVGCLIC